MTEAVRQMGPWVLGDKLGEGGNSVVYRATRADGRGPVALKVINERRVEEESYQRFLREVEFMTTHRSRPGLLPLIDAYLPEKPTKADRAWLATPVATRIDEALAAGSLDDVVVAVTAVARTLATLQEQFDVPTGTSSREICTAWTVRGSSGTSALSRFQTWTSSPRTAGRWGQLTSSPSR